MTTDIDPRYYWVALNLVKGIGAVRMRMLLDHFGNPIEAWQASIADLQAAGMSARLIDGLVTARKSGIADRAWETILKLNIQVLIWDDPDYPRSLAEIDQPPPVIYVRGSITEADRMAAGMVGTRKASVYGRQIAEEMSEFLARQGLTIVSGLARGIDGFSHDAALKAGGRTLAVLGSGVDQIYPPEHRRLAERVIAQGAIISDYPPGTPPDAANFPPRNRIISGLSLAVIVVEAGEKSGALITAAFAAEQGRQVFAIPGSLYAPLSRGPNRLIQQGAHLLLHGQEVLDLLHLGNAREHQAARAILPTDPIEARLYHVLGREPLHVDEIFEQAGLPIDQVSATLAMMELKGLVRQVGGMQYVAVYEESSEYTV